MLRRALIYGGLIALAGAVLTFGMDAAGLEADPASSQLLGLVGLLFPIIGIVLAIRSAKNADPGPFSFGDGFKQGALVSLVAAVLAAVFTYLYVTAVNPDYLDAVRAATEAQLRERGLTGPEFEQAQSLQAGMSTPGAVSSIGFMTQLILGLIVSAVAAAILRRKEQPSTGDGYGG